MKQDSSTDCWNKVGNESFDIAQTNDFRMYFIMPFTLNQLGDVFGEKVLDIGCGEGGYSRKLARSGAHVTSVDCAVNAINYAKQRAEIEHLKITHFVRNSNDLYDIADNAFDIVLCSMMLMDCEDLYGTVKEISRVLKPGGRLFVSVLHPCFNGKNIKWSGGDVVPQVVIQNYFSPTEWEAPFSGGWSVIWRHHTLQDYVKVFTKNGLRITDLNEPIPAKEQMDKSPRICWLSKIPMFLFIELEK